MTIYIIAIFVTLLRENNDTYIHKTLFIQIKLKTRSNNRMSSVYVTL